jgi:hypothetical protein
MKWLWYRYAINGKVEVHRRRLDASAKPAWAHVPDGYGDTGYQSRALYFAREGCWEITAHVGTAQLTFVTLAIHEPSPE